MASVIRFVANPNCVSPLRAPRKPSTPYDSGSTRVTNFSAMGIFVNGNSAPDKKKIGSTRKFMMS